MSRRAGAASPLIASTIDVPGDKRRGRRFCDDCPFRHLLLIAVAVLVGVATRINGGNYDPVAIAFIIAAIVPGLIAIADPFGIASRVVAGRWLHVALLAAIVGHAATLLAGPLVTVGGEISDTAKTVAGIGLGGVMVGAILCSASRFMGCGARSSLFVNAGIAILLASHLVGGLAMVRIALPPMDVIVFQDLAAHELLDGGKPWSMTFPDLSGGTSPHYGPGLQANGQLLFGFPYPPLSLLVVASAPLFGGDYGDFRFIHAFCMTGVGAAIALTRRSAAGLAAAMFLLTPIGPQVIANGWTEPLVAALLALVVAVAVLRPRWAGVPLGLLWSAKQYVPLTAPLMLLLPPVEAASPPLSSPGDSPENKRRGRRFHVRTLLLAIFTGGIVTLPLVLNDPTGVWRSVVTLQLSQPFRPDALSFLSLVHHLTGIVPPSWPAFVALAAVQAVALWRLPRTVASFAAATAVSLLVFFALSKQAFANYYFLVIAAAVLAVAATERDAESSTRGGRK